jgi:hypothetical protein
MLMGAVVCCLFVVDWGQLVNVGLTQCSFFLYHILSFAFSATVRISLIFPNPVCFSSLFRCLVDVAILYSSTYTQISKLAPKSAKIYTKPAWDKCNSDEYKKIIQTELRKQKNTIKLSVADRIATLENTFHIPLPTDLSVFRRLYFGIDFLPALCNVFSSVAILSATLSFIVFFCFLNSVLTLHSTIITEKANLR